MLTEVCVKQVSHLVADILLIFIYFVLLQFAKGHELSVDKGEILRTVNVLHIVGKEIKQGDIYAAIDLSFMLGNIRAQNQGAFVFGRANRDAIAIQAAPVQTGEPVLCLQRSSLIKDNLRV